ncbi:hypothetical protein BC940DRAFT_309630 [Gongronella butleri]|nr:hypothetical protein BC940DRAFT_309630 [Gongronella butleri]
MVLFKKGRNALHALLVGILVLLPGFLFSWVRVLLMSVCVCVCCVVQDRDTIFVAVVGARREVMRAFSIRSIGFSVFFFSFVQCMTRCDTTFYAHCP